MRGMLAVWIVLSVGLWLPVSSSAGAVGLAPVALWQAAGKDCHALRSSAPDIARLSEAHNVPAGAEQSWSTMNPVAFDAGAAERGGWALNLIGAPPAAMGTFTTCDAQSEISEAECNALVALYDSCATRKAHPF